MKQSLLLHRIFTTLLLLTAATITWAYDFEVNGIGYTIYSDGTDNVAVMKTDRYDSLTSIVIPSSVKDKYNDKTYTVKAIGEKDEKEKDHTASK